MGWFILGLLLGYIMGWNRKADNIPKDLEKCTVELGKHEQDIAYYKKLTRNLVEENKELRKQINDA
jgi:hypothetical protein